MNRIRYEFKSEVWRHQSTGGWFFISMPIDLAQEIRDNLKFLEQGWGRFGVVAKIDDVEWKTSIWFDTKMNTYLLPVKSEIREALNLNAGSSANVTVII